MRSGKYHFARLAVSGTLLPAFLLTFTAAAATAQLPAGSWGFRAGAGTDIQLGVAFGGQLNYQFEREGVHLEVGPTVYYSNSKEETIELRTYNETTEVTVFGVMANWLFGYDPDASASYFVAGIGAAGIYVWWEETSPDDSSLGTPFGAAGSMQEAEGTSGGTVLNLGVGQTFGGQADIRVETPMILIFGAPGEASAFVPTLTVTLGVRFR